MFLYMDYTRKLWNISALASPLLEGLVCVFSLVTQAAEDLKISIFRSTFLDFDEYTEIYGANLCFAL